MKTYKENDLVIYTDSEGNRVDTFVIFDTDRKTRLTHINHYNLKVKLSSLKLHPNSASGTALPLADPLSFELFRWLKDKYLQKDLAKNTNNGLIVYNNIGQSQLAKAS